MVLLIIIIIIIIIILLHRLGRLTCSGIEALPSFPGASTISSPPRSVVEGVFRKSGVVHSFEVHIYTTLAFLALLGDPYIHEISSLRVNIIKWQVKFNPVA